MRFEGSDEETQVRLFLAGLDIDYDKLTKEVFVTLIGILRKSAHMKKPPNLNGKGQKKKKRK